MACTRCGKQAKTLTMFKVRAGGHMLPSLTQPDLDRAIPPQTERVCGDCLTDDEIVLQLSPAVGFVLGILLQNVNPDFPNAAVALETARAMFIVYNNEPNTSIRGRWAAVKALGLEGEVAQ